MSGKVFIEYETSVKQSYDKVSEMLVSVNFEKSDISTGYAFHDKWDSNNRNSVLSLINFLKSEGYEKLKTKNESDEHYVCITYARISLSHSRRKCYVGYVSVHCFKNESFGTYWAVERKLRERHLRRSAPPYNIHTIWDKVRLDNLFFGV